MSRRRAMPRDAGVTLAELLVAMTIMVVFSAVFSSIAVKMFAPVGDQQARSDNLDATRNLLQVLDRQVRYADVINSPTTVSGSSYVTFRAQRSTGTRTDTAPAARTCYQWRVTAVGDMQYRQWQPPATTASGWSTVATGIAASGGSAIFSVTATVNEQSRQQLSLSFVSGHGVRRVDTPTTAAFTALNTTSSAPSTSVCQEVAPQ